jgi:hypothetical protein
MMRVFHHLPASLRKPPVASFSDEDLLCAVAAKAEGATWRQIEQMFPFGAEFGRAMGRFTRKWLPDWSPSFRPSDPACLRAVIRNYIWQQQSPAEWMSN